MRLHQEPVGKGATAGTGDLISQQLDRAVEDSVIVRLKNANFSVIDQPNHARLFDGRPEQWNRFQQQHPLSYWRVFSKDDPGFDDVESQLRVSVRRVFRKSGINQARMRRTDVLPMLSRRAIPALLMPER